MVTQALVMKTLQMINIIALELIRNPDWPNGEFPVVLKKIKRQFGLDDDMVVIYMNEYLHKIKINKQKDP